MGTGQGIELTRNLSRNARPQSSQIAESLWTDYGRKSGRGGCELISTLKKVQAGNDLSNLPLKPSHVRNKPRTIIFVEESVLLILVIIDRFLTYTQRALTKFPNLAVEIACENANQ